MQKSETGSSTLMRGSIVMEKDNQERISKMMKTMNNFLTNKVINGMN
jgi:hypothetical protein